MGQVPYNVKIYLVSQEIDFILWIFYLTLIIYTTIFRISDSNKVSKRKQVAIFTGLLLRFPLVLTFLSAIRWILNGLDGIQPFSDPSWSIAFMELQITSIFQPILPRLFVLFSAAWLLRLLLFPYEKTAKSFITNILNNSSIQKTETKIKKEAFLKYHQIILIFSIITVAFIGIYPYLPTLNPSSLLVSVDVNFYYTHLQNINNVDTLTFLSNIIQQDRSLFLIFQQIIATLVGSADLAIRIIPALLGVMLTASVYYFISNTLNDKKLAALSALFTATSFQIVAGINAGFYANLLALIELNLFFTFFLKAINNTHKISRQSIISVILLILILFTHSATWLVVMASLVTFSTITFIRRTPKLHETIIVSQIIIINIFAELIKNNLIQSTSTTGVAQSMTPQITYSNLLQVFKALDTTFTYFLGGAYANATILILATIGLFYIAMRPQKIYQILLAFTIVCTVGTFFTSANFPEIFQSRFIYLIPFQIFAAIGLSAILNFSTRVYEKTGIGGTIIPLLIQVIIFTSLLSYALRVVGYIYTV